MRLLELTAPNPIVTRLVAISDQLKTDLEKNEVGPEMTTDQLLQYLSNYDIVVDKKDLYNMIQKPPLKDVISNIQGDSVVFKDQETPDQTQPEDESQKIVSQMADKAANKMK